MAEQFNIPQATLEQQFASSNPHNSAWVAANAGSGKTHVLTQRVVRLLLAGNAPDRILCLTFTKAAAANMKTRVFDTLGKWTMLEDDALQEAIGKFTGGIPKRETVKRARSLFANALDTPGGLKIQTIHSFCEALLRQFPLEANVPGHFETLQDGGQASLMEEARAAVLSGDNASPDLLEHFRQLHMVASAGVIDRALGAIIAMRGAFLEWTLGGVDEALAPLAQADGIPLDQTETEYAASLMAALPFGESALKELMNIAALSDKSTDEKLADNLEAFLEAGDPLERLTLLKSMGLTGKGDLRSTKSYPTKFVKEQLPDAPDLIISIGEAALHIQERLGAHRSFAVSRHLFHLGRAVLERYEAAKRARGVVDFDDQIEKTANLLYRSDIREWIRYRLDQGIDHLLVDEAQDTSPKQWSIINAVTEDFHAGITAASANRTIFVVGDEKQSIYSFQGADPAEFSRQQKRLEKSVNDVGKPYHPGRLNLSFRSTKDVLHAVDKVFALEDNRRGLDQSGEQPVHDAVRANAVGEVHIWPLYAAEKREETEDWLAPVDDEKQSDPAVQLASRIAQSIRGLVGKPLPGSDTPVKFSDILVLVRRRDRLITALTRTMKDAGLAVAGADRFVLTDHIAVEDLLALGRFALLPEDDLNLASLLKSAFFNLSEEHLFALAHDRKGRLITEVEAAAVNENHTCHNEAARISAALARIRQKANTLGVFEFYAWVLGPFGGRKAFLSRLGSEAEDLLDSFLEEAIGFSREGGIGLENFISGLLRAQPEIKREVELERDEVRILTVHASKGLEAKIVFLVDPCTPAWIESHRPAILKVNAKESSGYLWQPTKEFASRLTTETVESLRVAAEEEYRRLLYVGMTRAADLLVVCGYRGMKEPKEPHWHQMVSNALSVDAEMVFNGQGETETLVWRSPKTARRITMPQDVQDEAPSPVQTAEDDLPDWLITPAPTEAPLPYPLSPSGAHALIADEEDPTVEFLSSGNAADNIKSTAGGEPGFALQRGNAIHKLLELLPDIAQDQREEKALAWLARLHPDWSDTQIASVWKDVSGVLNAGGLAEYFALPSRSEVSVAGKIETAGGTRMIAGQIDRLVIGDEEIIILDYKTSRRLPQSLSDVPAVYITQLALYREIVRQIYPEREVSCALMWTRGPLVTDIPAQAMDEAIVNIRSR